MAETSAAEQPVLPRAYPKGYFIMSLLVSGMILGALGMALILGGAHNNTQARSIESLSFQSVAVQRVELRSSGRFITDSQTIVAAPGPSREIGKIDDADVLVETQGTGLAITVENGDGLSLKTLMSPDGKVTGVSCSAAWPGSCPVPADFG